MQLDELVGERQAYAGTRQLVVAQNSIAFEKFGHIGGADASALIADDDVGEGLVLPDAEADALAVGGELDGVGHQVVDHRLDQARVDPDLDKVVGHGELQVDVLVLGQQAEAVERRAHHGIDADLAHVEVHLVVLHLAEVEQLIDKQQDAVGVALNDEHLAVHLVGQSGLEYVVDGREDERERRADFVRYVGEELQLYLVDALDDVEVAAVAVDAHHRADDDGDDGYEHHKIEEKGRAGLPPRRTDVDADGGVGVAPLAVAIGAADAEHVVARGKVGVDGARLVAHVVPVLVEAVEAVGVLDYLGVDEVEQLVVDGYARLVVLQVDAVGIGDALRQGRVLARDVGVLVGNLESGQHQPALVGRRGQLQRRQCHKAHVAPEDEAAVVQAQAGGFRKAVRNQPVVDVEGLEGHAFLRLAVEAVFGGNPEVAGVVFGHGVDHVVAQAVADVAVDKAERIALGAQLAQSAANGREVNLAVGRLVDVADVVVAQRVGIVVMHKVDKRYLVAVEIGAVHAVDAHGGGHPQIVVVVNHQVAHLVGCQIAVVGVEHVNLDAVVVAADAAQAVAVGGHPHVAVSVLHNAVGVVVAQGRADAEVRCRRAAAIVVEHQRLALDVGEVDLALRHEDAAALGAYPQVSVAVGIDRIGHRGVVMAVGAGKAVDDAAHAELLVVDVYFARLGGDPQIVGRVFHHGPHHVVRLIFGVLVGDDGGEGLVAGNHLDESALILPAADPELARVVLGNAVDDVGGDGAQVGYVVAEELEAVVYAVVPGQAAAVGANPEIVVAVFLEEVALQVDAGGAGGWRQAVEAGLIVGEADARQAQLAAGDPRLTILVHIYLLHVAAVHGEPAPERQVVVEYQDFAGLGGHHELAAGGGHYLADVPVGGRGGDVVERLAGRLVDQHAVVARGKEHARVDLHYGGRELGGGEEYLGLGRGAGAHLRRRQQGQALGGGNPEVAVGVAHHGLDAGGLVAGRGGHKGGRRIVVGAGPHGQHYDAGIVRAHKYQAVRVLQKAGGAAGHVVGVRLVGQHAERLVALVEVVVEAVVGLHPDEAEAVLPDVVDAVVAARLARGRQVLEDAEGLAVVAVEAVGGAQPHESVAVEQNAVDGVLRQAVARVDILESLDVLRGEMLERQKQCRQHKHYG